MKTCDYSLRVKSRYPTYSGKLSPKELATLVGILHCRFARWMQQCLDEAVVQKTVALEIGELLSEGYPPPKSSSRYGII